MPSFRWAVAFALTGVLLGAYEATVALYAAHSAPSVQLGGVGNCTLVVAHPDDEAMFFAPSVVALRSACTLHVFFMTTGDADGLGHVRRREAAASCAALGVPPHRVHVMDDPRLRDGMTAVWDDAVAVQVVCEHLAHVSPRLVLTFDVRGASGHVNHVAVHTATGEAVRAHNARTHAGAPVQLWALETAHPLEFLEPVRVAHVAVQDAVARVAAWVGRGRDAAPHHPPRRDARLVLVTASHAPSHAAMVAHTTQYVWHRLLHVWLGPYARVNVLRRLMG